MMEFTLFYVQLYSYTNYYLHLCIERIFNVCSHEKVNWFNFLRRTHDGRFMQVEEEFGGNSVGRRYSGNFRTGNDSQYGFGKKHTASATGSPARTGARERGAGGG